MVGNANATRQQGRSRRGCTERKPIWARWGPYGLSLENLYEFMDELSMQESADSSGVDDDRGSISRVLEGTLIGI